MTDSTNTVIQSDAYSAAVATTKAAVQGDLQAGNRWRKAGDAVAALFATPEAFAQVKAQFCADAIIPALPQEVRNALALKLPRKGSPEADAFEGLEEAKARLKSARDTVQVYFGRISAYAFPKPKADKADKGEGEGEGEADKADGKSPAEKLASMSTVFAAAAKVLERDADAFRAALPGFDPAACGAHVMAALALIVNAQAAQAK